MGEKMKKTMITTLSLLVVVSILPSIFATTEIEMNLGAGSSECVNLDTCFTPSNLMSKRSIDILAVNHDNLPHTLTSGTAREGPDGIFDTGMIISNQEKTISGDQLTKDGRYDYFCMVHPWMVGQINIVKDFYPDTIPNSPEWFKQVEQWHKEGKVPDDEYYWAVGYLNDKGLL